LAAAQERFGNGILEAYVEKIRGWVQRIFGGSRYVLYDRPASIREVISLALIVAMLALSVPAAARGRWSAVGRCWFTRNEGAGSEARRPTAKFGKRC